MTENLLRFIENSIQNLKVRDLPLKVTVTRTKQSKYLFYLVARALKKRLGLETLFIQYTKQEQEKVRALIEEYSLFNKNSIFIMEGFGSRFIESLVPQPGNYIVAETDKGDLEALKYTRTRKRDILKVLSTHFSLKFKLSYLKALNWEGMRDYSEYESILRKATVAQWSLEKLGSVLTGEKTSELLPAIKRGEYKKIYNLSERFSASWVYKVIVERLAELVQFKTYEEAGYEDKRIGIEMELNFYRCKELREASTVYSMEDIESLVERWVWMYPVYQRNPALALDNLILNTPIRLRK